MDGKYTLCHGVKSVVKARVNEVLLYWVFVTHFEFQEIIVQWKPFVPWICLNFHYVYSSQNEFATLYCFLHILIV